MCILADLYNESYHNYFKQVVEENKQLKTENKKLSTQNYYLDEANLGLAEENENYLQCLDDIFTICCFQLCKGKIKDSFMRRAMRDIIHKIKKVRGEE